jgi:cytidine deaminase
MALNADEFKDALSGLAAAEQQQLLSQRCSEDFNGQLTANNSSAAELAQFLLPLAATFSVAPVSGFHVGAVAVGTSGALYLGANLEFANAPLSATLHAEQSAVLNAWTHGETAIATLLVSEAPCGHCRQFLSELGDAPTLAIRFRDHSVTLQDLLPLPFTVPRAPGEHLLASATQAIQALEPITSDLGQHALDAATRSYTPYTKVPEGIALKCANGQCFTGAAMESCAFNPTVAPLICALNQRNLSASRDVPISACMHTQHQGAHHSNIQMAKALLQTRGDCELQTLTTADHS